MLISACLPGRAKGVRDPSTDVVGGYYSNLPRHPSTASRSTGYTTPCRQVTTFSRRGSKLTGWTAPSLDHRFMTTITTSLRRVAPSTDVLESLIAACPPQASGGSDLCPACRQPVDGGDLVGVSKCSKGHEWSQSKVIQKRKVQQADLC
jgi:hypothetical protein